ncbi:MAG: YihY/virulence factor BrkB family protein [Bryobacteraceae bacterium]
MSPDPQPVISTPPKPRWRVPARAFYPTLKYWMETEVHVYSFSIAANVLLSFFPFLIVILSVCRPLLGWHGAENAIGLVMDDFFPGDLRTRDSMASFVYRIVANAESNVESRGTLQIFSLLLLLFTANGIFEPLEIALNRVWGIPKNRTLFKNQLVSLGLIFTCGGLALASTLLTGINLKHLGTASLSARILEVVFFKMAALPVSILMLFLIYWLLPNGRIPWRSVLPQAILVGIALEALKYINLLTWPLLSGKLKAEYGPFQFSVTIILWSFLGAMVILAGAEWAARRHRRIGPL